MKLAILLPGYLDSNYTEYMLVFEKRLSSLGYKVERLDPCNLSAYNHEESYTITNYLNSIENTIKKHHKRKLNEVILIGHSLGGAIAIVAGNKFKSITKIVSMCTPIMLGKSTYKWANGFRLSTRPINKAKTKFRRFNIPSSFLKDAKKYSILENTKKFEKPMLIFVALDDKSVLPTTSEQLISVSNNPTVIRKEKIDHEFIYSEEASNLVMDSIEPFLKT